MYSVKSGKIDEWLNKGETKDSTYIIKNIKVGVGIKLRTRYILQDGTVGVSSDVVDLGAVPRRGGLIVLGLARF